jgi:methionine-gamma-lyase
MKKLSSKIIHTGDGQYQKKLIKAKTVPETFPIFFTSVFAFDGIEPLEDIAVKKNDGYIYTRSGGPNSDAVSEIIAAAENAEGGGALVFSSGMAAITSSVLSLLKSGDHIIAQIFYTALFLIFLKMTFRAFI